MTSSPDREPMMTLYAMSDDQMRALEDRIVERVAAEVSTNWLPREPMTLNEAAAYLRVHTKTIRDWINAGALGSWKHGNTVLIMPNHVADFIERGQR